MGKYLSSGEHEVTMAAKKDTFLLVSLDESRTKKLAQVVGSDTCRRMLDFLAEKEATESEMASGLQMPLSTVHYNIKMLADAGLVTSEEFHYSPKGREVSHYKLANKYIIIAPKTTEGLAGKLKKILPVATMVAATGIALQFIMQQQGNSHSTQEIAQASTIAAGKTAVAAAQAAAATQQPIAAWFIAGGLFALLALFIANKAVRK
jgi:DNA-binding transcriptional ArsR family regulator